MCAVCKDAFTNPWDLMVHAQAAHMVNIYELGSEPNNNSSSTANNNTNTNTGTTGNSSSSSLTTEDGIVTIESKLPTSAVLATNEPNINNNNNSNNGLHYNNDNDSNNNNTKNHNGIGLGGIAATLIPSSRDEANCFSLPGKMQQHVTVSSASATSTTSLANVNGSDVIIGVMSSPSNDNVCNGIVMSSSSSSGAVGDLGHSSDTEAHLELKFGICNSPIATINNKEVSSGWLTKSPTEQKKSKKRVIRPTNRSGGRHHKNYTVLFILIKILST